MVKDHVLLPFATELEPADELFKTILAPEIVTAIVNTIPSGWLVNESAPDAEANREVYRQFLLNRIAHSHIFVKQAQHAREVFV